MDIRIAVLIPAYNNATTVGAVASSAKEYCDDIIVVDDGSTDNTQEVLAGVEGIDVLTFPANCGKGCGIRAGFERAAAKGVTHVITMDGDAQHLAIDIPRFIEKIHENPEALWVGNRTLDTDGVAQPSRSRVGRGFGNFWYRFNTGVRLHDTQCGFRAYPLAGFMKLKVNGTRYEYEQEALLKAAWHGISVAEVDVHLNYQPEETRVSHFRPFRDFMRISVVNGRAAFMRIVFPVATMDVPGDTVWQKTGNLIKDELKVHHRPLRAAVSVALGVFLGLFPIHGFQVVSMSFFVMLFKLNFPLAFIGVSVSSAPFLPFLILASVWIGRRVLPADLLNIQVNATVDALAEGGIAFVVGSVILAVLSSVAVFSILYPIFSSIARVRQRTGKPVSQ